MLPLMKLSRRGGPGGLRGIAREENRKVTRPVLNDLRRVVEILFTSIFIFLEDVTRLRERGTWGIYIIGERGWSGTKNHKSVLYHG